MKRIGLMIVAMCLMQGMVRAEEGKSDSERVQIIRNCLKSFLQTLDEPTITPASDSFVGDNDEFQLVKGYYELNHATIDSLAALKKRFPAEMAKSKSAAESGSLVNALVARLEHDPVIITGDKAVVGRIRAGITLKEVDGVWKISSLLSDADTRDKLIAKFKVTVEVSKEFAAEIDAGKYATAAEAQRAFAAKVQAASAAAGKSSSTKPAF